MALRTYLATEIALDHADGLLTRRDALHKLGLLGLTTAAASTLLASCSSAAPPAAAPSAAPAPPASSAAATPTRAGLRRRRGTRPHPGRDLPRRHRHDVRRLRGRGHPRGAVLVVHENRGLTDHIRAVAGRLAGDGYSALAPDLLSRRGHRRRAPPTPPRRSARIRTEPTSSPTCAAGLTSWAAARPGAKLGIDRVLLRRRHGVAAARRRRAAGWRPRSRSTARPRTRPTSPGSQAAVLGVFAELDARVNAGRDTLEAALTAAGLTHEIVTVPGRGPRVLQRHRSALQRGGGGAGLPAVLDWFGAHLT